MEFGTEPQTGPGGDKGQKSHAGFVCVLLNFSHVSSIYHRTNSF